jgi:NAD(P)-dependent dehydrogenase (short-subunit alcohol dehydrogenase family)
MTKLKCQMNVKTNPNIKAQMINLNFGFWNLTFSRILILASCNLHLETFVVAENLHHEPMTGLAYDVSKAALNRFTVGLAEELREYHIAVNALMPDNTETEGWSYLNPDMDRSSWHRPDVWGRYAVFLAMQDPDLFTGKLLIEDELKKECEQAGL